MLDRIYFRIVRKLITKKQEQNRYSGGFWPRLVRETSAEIIKSNNARIVELGCGEGLFLELLSKNNPEAEIYGVDMWENILSEAKERLKNFKNVKLIHSDARFTELKQKFFDYCFCLNTILNLESINDVELLFLEIKRILKSSGIFIFDIRNSINPIIRLQYRFVKFYDRDISVPVNAYTMDTMTKLLKKTGFKINEKKFIGFPRNKFAPAILFIAEKI